MEQLKIPESLFLGLGKIKMNAGEGRGLVERLAVMFWSFTVEVHGCSRSCYRS